MDYNTKIKEEAIDQETIILTLSIGLVGIIFYYISNSFAYMEWKYRHQHKNGTPFIIACEQGNLQDVHAYVEQFNIDVNLKGKTSKGEIKSGIYIAKEKDKKDIVKYLLSKGATEN